MLMVALSQEKPKKAVKLVDQIKKLIAGTHNAILIQAPNVKKNTKGRPSTKKGQTTSTKRNQLAFEIVEEHMKKEKTAKKQALKESGSKKAKQFKKADSNDIENSDLEEEEFVCKDNNEKGDKNKLHELEADSINLNEENKLSKSHLVSLAKGGATVLIHEKMKEFIKEIFNPTGNGNCGYHCVAKALAYKEDRWFQVRNKMLNKAKENRRFYSRLMGGEAGFNSMINSVEVESKDANIEESKWLSKMDHVFMGGFAAL
ncbi:hypothetical protein PCANC_21211 [Puccinia coronata f. sp. avenae]|uniref:OTU domain-containing protein n=1 Tax=Puccinia coronata f. sp. avenae TaxID=200324 RepID=A0A2N5UGQ3_9BASI|nr:hypothetical protein PCANC_21211 [Puccinia coronata f. sp. avenae]